MIHTFNDPAIINRRFKPIEYVTNEKGCWICVSHCASNKRTADKKERSEYVLLRRNGKQTSLHRYSYELHYGPLKKGKCVLHRCDEPACFNPAHLKEGTQPENMKDRDSKGRQAKGTQIGISKLDDEKVKQILLDQRKYTVIAKDYGVSATTISHIKIRKTWKHLNVGSEQSEIPLAAIPVLSESTGFMDKYPAQPNSEGIAQV